jgi:Na+-transporting methylmalonyl-CoA/oxaloacetate decarboxylase gamma subunit
MEHLGWGLQMTVLGMGLVFLLLAVLWGLLNLVLKLDREPEAPATREAVAAEAEEALSRAEDKVGVQVPGIAATVNGMEADLVAAMMVAVLRHKAERREVAAASARSYWPGSLLYASRWVGAGRSRQTRTWQPKGR